MRTPIPPSAPVDISAAPQDPEGRAWSALSLLPVAAFGFALLAWIATVALAIQSESKGVAGATVAMFPSGFGVAGLWARAVEQARLDRGRPLRLGRVLSMAFGGGVVAVLGFAFFMTAIWPSL